MPARAREEAEAVACGRGGSDAPARGRRARFQELRLPQEEQRQACLHGGEMQPLAQFQIELVDHAGDGGRRTRTQRLFHGPEGFVAVPGLGQDQTTRIEAETIAAMAMRTAIFAQSIGRHDEEEFFPPPTRAALAGARGHACWRRGGNAGKQRQNEAEGGRGAAFFRDDLMQGPAGKTALRQAAIDGGKTEGEGLSGRKPLHFGQQPAQFLCDSSAISHCGKAGRWGHSSAGRVDILGMFWSVQRIEHNENDAKTVKAVSTMGEFPA
jgi:hypothetical protein